MNNDTKSNNENDANNKDSNQNNKIIKIIMKRK